MVFFKNISILFILGKSRTKIIIIRNNQKTENLQHEMITRNENWTWKEIRNDSFAWLNRTTRSRSPWSHRVIDKVRLENWTRVSFWRNDFLTWRWGGTTGEKQILFYIYRFLDNFHLWSRSCEFAWDEEEWNVPLHYH